MANTKPTRQAPSNTTTDTTPSNTTTGATPSDTVRESVGPTPHSVPKTWLVDVDGTLARKGDRSPYDMSKVALDSPIAPVITLVQALAAHPQVGHIVIVSGRSEDARASTAAWLAQHRVPYSQLVLRAEGDHRPDEVVKREMLGRLRSEGYEIEGVVDDRDKVVAMWRASGLVCLQAAPGDF